MHRKAWSQCTKVDNLKHRIVLFWCFAPISAAAFSLCTCTASSPLGCPSQLLLLAIGWCLNHFLDGSSVFLVSHELCRVAEFFGAPKYQQRSSCAVLDSTQVYDNNAFRSSPADGGCRKSLSLFFFLLLFNNFWPVYRCKNDKRMQRGMSTLMHVFH